MNNTFGVIFYLRKYKATNDGKAPIYARITVNSSRTDLSVKASVSPANWHESKGMPKGASKEVAKLSQFLERYRGGIVESYQELLLEKKTITAELVKRRFVGDDRNDQTLCALMDYHRVHEGTILEEGTMKNYITTEKYVKEFLKVHLKTTDMFLSELNYQFITLFENYLRKRKPEKGQRPLSTNGVMKHIERFCKLLNLAVRLEWLVRNPFQAYKLKFQKVERQYLTGIELKTIEGKKFSVPRLEVVQDLFIFSCYTGLSYIDVFNLKKDYLVERGPDEYWLLTRRQKSDEPVKIPLLQKPLAIIRKYRDHPQVLAEGKLLPALTNQKLNSYLKEIADICGITKPLTFHIARHTFATTVTLTNGVPIETVSKLLGHTQLRTTQVYAKVVESKLGDDMAQLSRRLANK